jgi:hypothetical protein
MAAVMAAPRGVEAQQPTNAPRVGYLGGSSPKVAARWQDAFRRGLRELGYVEGQSIIIEWRSAEGHPERLPELATELVRLNPAAIVTSGDDVTAVVKQATATIPIVMATSSDPVALGYASSLAFPGGNITGLSGQLRELPVKRVQLIKELLPKAERFGHLTRPDSNIGDIGLGEFDLDANARAIGLTRQIFRVIGRVTWRVFSRQWLDSVLTRLWSAFSPSRSFIASGLPNLLWFTKFQPSAASESSRLSADWCPTAWIRRTYGGAQRAMLTKF